MEFRRSGERRRRVLMDESRLDADRPEGKASLSADPCQTNAKDVVVHGYAVAARRERQPPITDLIPIRRWSVLVVGLVLCTIWTGLQALHGCSQLVWTGLPNGLLRAFDLQRVDSIAGWYASLQLAAMALMAIGIFSIRRHRLDDYRGRYRVWLWVATFGWMASIESTAGMRTSIPLVVKELTGARLAVSFGWWWAPLAVVFFTGFLRVMVETRRSLVATASLAIASLGYAVVFLDQARPLLPPSVLRGMAISGTLLASHSCAVLGLLVYARFVFLEAQGLVQVTEGRARRVNRSRSAPRPPSARKPRAKSLRPSTAQAAPSQAPASQAPASQTAPSQAVRSSNVADGTLASKVGATIHAETPRPKTPPVAAGPPVPVGPTVAKHTVSRPSIAKPAPPLAVSGSTGLKTNSAGLRSDESNDDREPSLSRSERKRLKKDLRRQQRTAA